MRSGTTSRADMHCHSTASQISRLGVQRAVGLPECATPPEEVYELAKRRGMDFVTITDHDTIDGVLEIADREDVFVSEELTAHFRGEAQAVHVLCYGITPEDHEWLQANAGDVEVCAEYLHENRITCALAHPYYAVGAPLTARHRRRLAHLFEIWEVRNGSRAKELNRPAQMYAATLDSIGIGGSDDHAGVDIGRTWTQTPAAATPQEFLRRIHLGTDVVAGGAQGSAAKWAHAAIALAARSLGAGAEDVGAPDPLRVMTLIRRVLSEADVRHGASGGDLTPQDARCLLRAWLGAVGLDHLDEADLIAYMQREEFSHADLYRRASRLHEGKLREAVCRVAGAAAGGAQEIGPALTGLFEGCIAGIPYAPSTAFLSKERRKLDGRRDRDETARVAILADGIGSRHGVSRTIEEIRHRGVPGYEIEVVGTDPEVDRRLPAVAELDVPFYPGLKIGVPSLTTAAEVLTAGAFDAIHVCSPGPAGIAGALLARALGLPLIGSYHTELTAYAGLRSGRPEVAQAMDLAMAVFYNACDLVLSPSPASDATLAGIGITGAKVLRWDRGVDTSRFDPALRDPELFGEDTVKVLYAGRITREKGAELLAESFMQARRHEPRLQLVLAGGGPEQPWLAERMGEAATFLGWLDGPELARAYASADIFIFPSATDTFGQVILEAQASGLPVLAVAEGGPLALIRDGITGLLREADANVLARSLVELAGAPLLRERLAAAGLASVRERTWERALGRLATSYALALVSDQERAAQAVA